LSLLVLIAHYKRTRPSGVDGRAARHVKGIVSEHAVVVCRFFRDVLDDVPMLDWSLPQGGVHAVYPNARYISAKVRAFVDFLREYLR
jgi:DNA-binding transcriptional LysR family regulator